MTMKKTLITALLATSIFAGCTKDNKPTLYVYNWAEYIDPDVIGQFEETHNCHVNIDTFDSNEAMLAKLLAGSAGYDVIFPTSYIIQTMADHDLLEQVDTNKLPNVMQNFDHAYDRFMSDVELKWSVPYAFGMTGIGYRSDKVDFPTNISWAVLGDKKIKRICILDDIREMLGIGLKFNGFSINSTNESELATAVKTLAPWKENATKLDNVQYRTGLVSSEIYVAIGYNSDVLQVQSESPETPIKFKIPVEGSTCCFDEIVIMKGGKVDLAHQFIDFLYRADVAAQNCKYICSAQPNSGMKKLMATEDLENELMFPSEEILKRLEPELAIDAGLEAWNRAWDQFKAIK